MKIERMRRLPPTPAPPSATTTTKMALLAFFLTFTAIGTANANNVIGIKIKKGRLSSNGSRSENENENEEIGTSPFQFYDDLRRLSSNEAVPIFGGHDDNTHTTSIDKHPHYVGRNSHRVRIPKQQLLQLQQQLQGDSSQGGGEGEEEGEAMMKTAEITSSTETEEIILCHVPMFLRYTGTPDSSQAYAASAGALLAMHHFNNGIGTIVPELQQLNSKSKSSSKSLSSLSSSSSSSSSLSSCNIKLTTEIIDTHSSPVDAVRYLAEMVVNRLPQDVIRPQPCAIFGSQISKVTEKLAMMSGVLDIFQVSSSAMSTELENLRQYPLLARSHTDIAGFGEMSISFLINNLGITKFALLVPQDSYGLGFQKSVLKEAAKNGMTSIQSQYMTTYTTQIEIEKEIRRALSVFIEHGNSNDNDTDTDNYSGNANGSGGGSNNARHGGTTTSTGTGAKRSGGGGGGTKYNYFIAAFYPEMLGTIMTIAAEMGLAGSGKFWMLSGTADTAPFVLSGKFVVEKDSLTAKAIAGTGIIFCKAGLPGVGGTYDKFAKEWRELGQRSEDLRYINSKQPFSSSPLVGHNGNGNENTNQSQFSKGADYFQALPHHIVTFSYDAIIALGLSACEAAGPMRNASYTSLEHRNKFASGTFRGASGDFQLRDSFPTRTANSSYFVMVNLLPNEFNTTHVSFKGSSVMSYWEANSSEWVQYRGNNFIYSDGSTRPPIELVPEIEEASSLERIYSILSPIIAITAIIGAFVYVKNRYKQADSIWNVKLSELQFDQPPAIIGRGTFGLVLLAQYRGTEVAVKRVIPPKERSQGYSSSFSESYNKIFCPIDALSGQVQGRANFTATSTTQMLSSQSSRNSGGESLNCPRVSLEKNSGTKSLKMGSKEITSLGVARANKFIICRGGPRHKALRKDFIREMRTLSKLRHPCITTVMGALLNGVDHEPMLVMEYMQHGSLHDILHNKTMYLDGEIIIPLLKDISQGMRFLHSAKPKIIHGDLKAANILVDSKFRAKVSDFGLSQKRKMVGRITGTPYWMAPELLRGETSNTAASDVYSFGMLLYEVVSRSEPYMGENYDDVMKGITDPMISKRPEIPSSCPPQLHSLMTDCLVINPENRPSFAEIDERLRRLDSEFHSGDDFVPIHSLQEKKDRTNRTNNLLFDVFPKHIAEALRDGKKIEPTFRDVVTIFFSDIVGFTSISSSLPPIKVSNMLDRLYNSFDILSHKHEVFKVETIGDAYMAVTNLVSDQPDHAKRIAEFAVDVLKAANTILIDMDDPSKGFVNLRIGFHSGAVVANVVGSRNPRYCLFGDTVNTSSRMESNSMVNRIHCSECSARYLMEQHPNMPLLLRGKISIKGKGEMKTYWVNEEVNEEVTDEYI